ncbi:hypothetical protein MKW94_028857 [Papaver nudicaule]|uniref:Neprosin PEP catalytic domain-containing protein n=1 Tax=Papaver nudicaule TaxID=74823 RepID=A0AA41SHH5_PAPNU|nr:hypothetical protein [Papaver nudicaule]
MEYSNASLIMFYVLLFVILTIETQSIEGGKANTSEKEDRELTKQLRILNKKPIKIITTKFGDTIDCIDIYKQPAFDHPLLKDHKIQMVPSSISEETTSKNISSTIFRGSNIDTGFQNERCPPETVPMRRTRKQDLINARYLMQKTNSIHTNYYTLSPMNYHFVSVEEFSEGKKYFGSAAWMSVHGFELNYEQFSTAQIWVQNGPAEKINSIEFGWMIYPGLFGDTHTRVFAYWTADGYKQTGCFNTYCPGFVQVSRDLYIGARINPVFVYGKNPMALPFKVYRDLKTGNWWLIINDITVGYWPKEIFTHLADNALTVRYGGIAGNEPQAPAPPMGNRYLPQLQDYSKTAFMTRMMYVDEKGKIVDINPDNIQTKRNTTLDSYDILFAGNIGGEYDITMAFGGPGVYVSLEH